MDINKLILEGLKRKKEKKENTEGTGAASSGSFAPKLSMWSEDQEAKDEYKRMEGEFTETAAIAAMAYDAPGFEDVNMKGNNPIGSGRSFKIPQIKGGGFVTFKKKCKTFPYCSQGDSKDKPVKVKKKLSPMSEAIENVSLRTGLTVEEIKNIILKKIDGNL